MKIRTLCAGILALALVSCGGHKEAVHVVSTPGIPAPYLTDAYLTDDRDNNVAKSIFAADSKPIYFMFIADHVARMPVRALWQADPPSSGPLAVVAEEELTSNTNQINGVFAARPPASGWHPGAYHLDIYLGDTLVHSEHFKIVSKAPPLDATLDEGDAAGSGMVESPVPMPPSAEPSSSSPTDTNVAATPTSGMPAMGVLPPMVTPIPTETPEPMRPYEPPQQPYEQPSVAIAHDYIGRPIITVNDSLQLHTSDVCHGVSFDVQVNGARQGVYSVPGITNDISLNFHPGANRLHIGWEAPENSRDCRLAIQINRHHRLRTLTMIHVFKASPPYGAENLAIVVE